MDGVNLREVEGIKEIWSAFFDFGLDVFPSEEMLVDEVLLVEFFVAFHVVIVVIIIERITVDLIINILIYLIKEVLYLLIPLIVLL